MPFTPAYASKASGTPHPGYASIVPYDFAVGHPDPANFPADSLAEATRRMLRRDRVEMALYPGEESHRPTRELIAQKLAHADGDETPLDWITITNGSMQGLLMLGEGLIDPGDTILVESFTYSGALRAFGSCHPRYELVPIDTDGIVVEELAAILDQMGREGRRPKFLYTIPNFQNPTGSVMSRKRRRGLSDLAAERELLIVEDDVYGDLVYEGEREPTLYGMRSIDNVIRLGTFSKIIGAGVRLGWMIAPPPMLAQLALTKIDGGTSSFASRAIAELLADSVEQRVTQMCDVYRAKRDAMLESLDTQLAEFAEWSRPRGGLFIWVRLPEGTDTVALLGAARGAGVDYLPGPSFSPTGAGTNYLRLSFAFLSPEEIRDGIAVLAGVLD